eukprot:5445152-Heterocapsa_arctica.AAC.1
MYTPGLNRSGLRGESWAWPLPRRSPARRPRGGCPRWPVPSCGGQTWRRGAVHCPWASCEH